GKYLPFPCNRMPHPHCHGRFINRRSGVNRKERRPSINNIYTLGYAAKGAEARLAELMTKPMMILVDIRLSPRSRFHPAFQQTALVQCYPGRYHHVPTLGNLNYKDRAQGIQLVNPALGLATVRAWLNRGYVVCLLCACANVETCHRATVARL